MGMVYNQHNFRTKHKVATLDIGCSDSLVIRNTRECAYTTVHVASKMNQDCLE